MRILHTSDWHLGRTLHGVDLTASHQAYLDHLIDMAAAEQVDAVVLAGDVYDRAYPGLDAVQQLEDALERLTALCRVVVTPGNHDSATRLGFGSRLFTDRLVIQSRVRDVGRPVEIPDADGDTGLLIYPLPYLDPDATRQELSDDDEPVARSHEAVMTAAMRRVSADLENRRARRRIPALAMAHGFVVGGQASDSERDIRVGGVDSIPHQVFGQALDYVALGHLHGPQRVGSVDGPGPLLRYSGSPLAFSFSERHHRKSTAVVSFEADDVRVELIDAPVPRRLVEVRGTLDEVIGRRFEADRKAWASVVVTGRQRPADLVATVKKTFPHALEIRFEPDGVVQTSVGVSREARDPLEVVAEFVTQVSNAAPDRAEHAVLREAYELTLAAEGSR